MLRNQPPNLFARLLGITRPDNALLFDESGIRDDLEALIDQYEETVDLLAEALATGAITLGQFAARMRREIRRLHLAAAVIGGGGSERATPQTRALAQQQIRLQLEYFDRWMDQLRAEQDEARQREAAVVGLVALALVSRRRAATAFVRTTRAALASRARSYGGAAVTTAAQATTSGRGLPQLPFQPASRTRCRNNCRCDWRILWLGGDDFDCYWELGVAEHCPTCLARSRAANPLRVRNGEIVDPAKYTLPSLYA